MLLVDPRLLRSNCYLDGRWEAADDGRTLLVLDPASGDPLGEVPLMGAAETTRAIGAAAAALPAWQAKTAKERAAVLRQASVCALTASGAALPACSVAASAAVRRVVMRTVLA